MDFIGQFPVRLDVKNRAFMPAGFRRQMVEPVNQTFGQNNVPMDQEPLLLVVRKDYFENCLVIYTMPAWEEEVAKVRSRLNRFDGNQQMLYRKMISEAQIVQLDPSGRILLPRALLDKVGIDHDAVFIGMQQTIEIWAQEKAMDGKEEIFMSDDEFADNIRKCMTD